MIVKNVKCLFKNCKFVNKNKKMSKFTFKDKQILVLIDPDKVTDNFLETLIVNSQKNPPACFLVGGSLITNNNFQKTITYLTQNTEVPVIIFPGNYLQISDSADGILLLSLISGRNSDFLIGHHVLSAMQIKKSKIQVIPTGYILVGGDGHSSVEYRSQTRSIPEDKIDIICSTAVAGELLGMQAIYLEAGSGAKKSISPEIISEVKKNISIPLIVGGGIKTSEEIENIFSAGANSVVIGTCIEKNPHFLKKVLTLKK